MRRGFLMNARSLSISALLDQVDVFPDSAIELDRSPPPSVFQPLNVTETYEEHLKKKKAENDARTNSFIPLPRDVSLEILRFAICRNDKFPTLSPCDWNTLRTLMLVSKRASQLMTLIIEEVNTSFVPTIPVPALVCATSPASALRMKKTAIHEQIIPYSYFHAQNDRWVCTSDGRCFNMRGDTVCQSWHDNIINITRAHGIMNQTVDKRPAIVSRLLHERNNVVWCSVTDSIAEAGVGSSSAFLTASGWLYYVISSDKHKVYVWKLDFREKAYRVMINLDGGIVWSHPKTIITDDQRYNNPPIITYSSEVYMWGFVENPNLNTMHMSPLIRLTGFDKEGLVDVFEDPDNVNYAVDFSNNHKVIFQCLDASSPSGKKEIKITRAQLTAAALQSTFTDEELAAMSQLMGI